MTQKAAATKAVDLKKIQPNPVYGHGRQEEQLAGRPGIMMRDLHSVPREQLQKEERERVMALREAIRRKRQKRCAQNSTEHSKQIGEHRNKEVHVQMASLTGEVSNNVTKSQPKPKQLSCIQRIRNTFRGQISTSEAASKYHTEYNPSYGHGRQEMQELSLDIPGIKHRDFHNSPVKIINNTSVVNVEQETTGPTGHHTRRIQRQTNPFLAFAELEIIDEEEVYDEINESEMIKELNLVKTHGEN